MDSHEREPCPHRIIDDLGGAFSFGAVGGALYYSFKGARNAPRGERTAGAVQAVKANARRLGGSFAVWGGLFSTFDCIMIAFRNKEDPYNSIVSGFCTGAVLASRGGANAAFKSGLVGGILLGVIEGLNIALSRVFAQSVPIEAPPAIEMDEQKSPREMYDELPWYVKLISPAPPKDDVDFSDPNEMNAAPAGGDDFSKSEKKWSSPMEAQIDSKTLFLLIRGHATDPQQQWRKSLIYTNSRQ